MPLCVAEPIDDLVGADGRMAAGDNLEDATTALGQPSISPRSLLLRQFHQQGKASSVIVITFREHCIAADHPCLDNVTDCRVDVTIYNNISSRHEPGHRRRVEPVR